MCNSVYVCLGACNVYADAQDSYKRVSDPLELELHVVGRHLRTQPCPLEDQQVLLTTESSPGFTPTSLKEAYFRTQNTGTKLRLSFKSSREGFL